MLISSPMGMKCEVREAIQYYIKSSVLKIVKEIEIKDSVDICFVCFNYGCIAF